MSFIVWNNTSYAITGTYDTAVAAALAAAVDTELTASTEEVSGSPRVGDWYWNDQVKPVPPMSKEAMKAAAKTWWRFRLDEMQIVWAMKGGNKHGQDWDRWTTTRFWIDGAGSSVVAACNSSDWTAPDCDTALTAFQTLVPKGGVSAWYFAHDFDDVWRGYYLLTGEDPTNIQDLETDSGAKSPDRRAFFKFSKGAAIPAFASDAASSIEWDGTGNTLDVSVPIGTEPETTT